MGEQGGHPVLVPRFPGPGVNVVHGVILAASVTSMAVTLVDVDDDVLAQLVHVATTGAAPDEVTPPLTSRSAWTPERTAWLRDYHRDRRTGLDGPLGEVTWAVVVDGTVVGGARLRWTEHPGVADTGVWLTRSARGAGVGRAALRAVLGHATSAGVRSVVAETAAGNVSALAVLRHLGFTVAEPAADGRVRAVVATGGANPGH